MATANILLNNGPGYIAKLLWAGFQDLSRALTFRKPQYIPVVGPEGSFAVMNTYDAQEGFRKIASEEWRNEVCARFTLTASFYRPIMKAKKLPCPTLIPVCENDTVCPPVSAKAVAKKAGKSAKVVSFPVTHFDIYVDGFEKSIQEQIAFFTELFQKKEKDRQAA